MYMNVLLEIGARLKLTELMMHHHYDDGDGLAQRQIYNWAPYQLDN